MTPSAPQNPSFLDGLYVAGGRVYDTRTRRLQFTVSNQKVPYRSWVQRWGMDLEIEDKDGQLQPRLLAHQERHQQEIAFDVPVPQDPDVTTVPSTSTITVGGTKPVRALSKIIPVVIPVGVEVPVRWFFTIEGDRKVYTVGHPDTLLTTTFKAGTDQVDFPFTVYPEIRKALSPGDKINLWPSMRCIHNSILAETEAVLDRRPSKTYSLSFTEVLYG